MIHCLLIFIVFIFLFRPISSDYIAEDCTAFITIRRCLDDCISTKYNVQ